MALNDHGQYSGVVDIARNGIDEVIRLKAQAKQDAALILQLVEALEVVASGNTDPDAMVELARATLAKCEGVK